MLTALLLLIVGFLAGALWLARSARLAGEAAEAACPPIGRFTEVSTARGPMRLHYLEKGPTEAAAEAVASGPPILMIHGLSGSLRHFSATVLDDLARERRVLAVDRPGMGYSDRLPGGPADLDAQADAIAGLLDALAVDPPLVIGHSLGGSVALALALRRPVAGLLLLAPATHPFKAKPPTPDATIDSPAIRRLIARTVGPMTVEKARPQNLSIAFGPQQPPAEFSLAAGGALMMRPSQIETTLEDVSMLQASLAAMAPRYGEVTAPIVILFGDRDGVLEAGDHTAPLAAKAPQAEIRILNGLGHMLPFAAADEVVDAARRMGALTSGS
ncbi:MAG: alpha/beta fold hydrolase [Pseudomonadota bacterium]